MARARLFDVRLCRRGKFRPARTGRIDHQSQFRKPARAGNPHAYRVARTGRRLGDRRPHRRSAGEGRGMTMEAFSRLTAVALPLMFDNIDTDIIIPSREMKRSEEHTSELQSLMR